MYNFFPSEESAVPFGMSNLASAPVPSLYHLDPSPAMKKVCPNSNPDVSNSKTNHQGISFLDETLPSEQNSS